MPELLEQECFPDSTHEFIFDRSQQSAENFSDDKLRVVYEAALDHGIVAGNSYFYQICGDFRVGFYADVEPTFELFFRVLDDFNYSGKLVYKNQST